VLDPFVHEATLGSSPNPCVSCNREVRLGTLFKKAQELQCDRVATGHGAQLLYDPRTGLYQLLQASDSGRDQSYFLFTLTQEELGRLLLPLGNFPNAMVSRLSAEYGFSMTPSLSQEICFSGSQGATSYIESRVAPSLRPQGVIRTYTQQVLGDHQGMHRIRAGEKPEVQVSAQEVEDFVAVGVDSANHAWIVGPPELLLKKDCLIFHANWLKPIHQLKGLRCQARLKPEGELLACQLTFFENQTVHIDFDQKQGPLFPGQAIVFYQDNEVLGGGWIRSTS
jgi:tRNA-specific 2-thiouridylase